MRFLVFLLVVLGSGVIRASDPQVIFEGAGSDAPKQPQAFVAPGNVVHVTFGVGERVYYCRGEQTNFGAAQIAFRVPNMSLGMRRGPRIAANSAAIVVTAIGGPQGKGKDGDLLAYRSLDSGQSWVGPVKVNDVEASAREGLHAMTVGDDGTFWCTWLDLRAKRTELYVASSRDHGQTWSKNILAYESPERSICECCHPSIAVRDQAVRILFRNSLKGNRDMYLIGSDDGGKTFSAAQRLGVQHWELNACPMDGGMLALSSSGQTTSVWRRGGTIYVSRGSEPLEQTLGKGEQSWIAMAGDQPHVVWTDAREGNLLYSALTDASPRKLAAEARDPVVVSNKQSPFLTVALWESRQGDRTRIVAQKLAD